MRPFPLLAACCLLFAAAPRAVHAVNLVPNASFETVSGCPTGFGQLSVATPWDVPNTGTSDCFNICVTGWPPFPTPDIPWSPIGIQTARTGDGMAGFIAHSMAPDYREYLQAPLATTLVNGATYQISFYVNLGDTCYEATDRIGAYLSSGPVGPFFTNTTLLLTPQVESPANTYLTDTVNWMLVSGLYTANGTETHLVIGNFRDDGAINVQSTGLSWPVCYYHVDDVSVELALPTEQACCGADGLCTMQFPGECELAGGSPMGPGTTCDTNPCGITPSRRSTWGGIKTIYR